MSFTSHLEQIQALMQRFVSDSALHGRWLNTLSCMENCGARQMAACEHPTLVREEMLKHAAEEFRHAHYLKAQIARVTDEALPNYRPKYLLGGLRSLQYLKALDTAICRQLKLHWKLKGARLREAAYALTSYAIERRAEELYPSYQAALKKLKSPISVSNIIKEEAHHLEEMIEAVDGLENGWEMAEMACGLEGELCQAWLEAIA